MIIPAPTVGRITGVNPRTHSGRIKIEGIRDGIRFNNRGSVMIRQKDGEVFLSNEPRFRPKMFKGMRVIVDTGIVDGDHQSIVRWAPYKIWIRFSAKARSKNKRKKRSSTNRK
ncbi:MAG: hypothetical protein WCO18_01460 [bacterium]